MLGVVSNFDVKSLKGLVLSLNHFLIRLFNKPDGMSTCINR